MADSPEALVNEFLKFFLEETQVLETDLVRLAGAEPAPVKRPEAIPWQVLAILKAALEAGQAAMALMATDPHPSKTDPAIAAAHHKIFSTKVRLGILDTLIHKDRLFPWCQKYNPLR